MIKIEDLKHGARFLSSSGLRLRVSHEGDEMMLRTEDGKPFGIKWPPKELLTIMNKLDLEKLHASNKQVPL